MCILCAISEEVSNPNEIKRFRWRLKILKFIMFVRSALACDNDVAAFLAGIPLPSQLNIGTSTAAYQIEGAWNTDGWCFVIRNAEYFWTLICVCLTNCRSWSQHLGWFHSSISRTDSRWIEWWHCCKLVWNVQRRHQIDEEYRGNMNTNAWIHTIWTV